MTAESSEKRRGKGLYVFLAIVLLAGTGVFALARSKRNAPPHAMAGPGGKMKPLEVPVVPGRVETKDVPIYLEGLGTVQAFNTVTVRSRVDGQVVKINFTEGQEVRAGEVLAQIDPAPFQAQLDQALAKKAEDEAQLALAQLTLQRNGELLASKILSQQEYDNQKAVVAQYQASVKADEAAIESARVQLAYTTITAPLDGRAGLRLIDQGNIVHANDSNGLVVLTQMRPISVVFTLPEHNLPEIQARLGAGEALTTYALGGDNRTTLAEGKLVVVDNQIDTATGTLRLKATFPNEDLKLWPGQFVNVRLLLSVRKDGLVVPASVIQHGPDGDFAYVIDDQMNARVRPVKVAHIQQGQALIDAGLTPDERVVVDGQYKLRPGAKVKLSEPPDSAPKTARSPSAKDEGTDSHPLGPRTEAATSSETRVN